jgi:hypothetical protein
VEDAADEEEDEESRARTALLSNTGPLGGGATEGIGGAAGATTLGVGVGMDGPDKRAIMAGEKRPEAAPRIAF